MNIRIQLDHFLHVALSAAAILIASSPFDASALPEPGEPELDESLVVKFMHYNDLHDVCYGNKFTATSGKSGGLAKLAAGVLERAERWSRQGVPFFVTDAGDIFDYHVKSQTSPADTEKTIRAYKAMFMRELPGGELLGSHFVIAPGDHDIKPLNGDSATNNNLRLEAFLEKAKNHGATVLAANLFVEEQGTKFHPGQAGFPWPDLIAPSKLVVIDTPQGPARIGFVGVTENDLSEGKLSTPDLTKSLQLAKKAVKDMLDQGAHVIVLVGHLGKDVGDPSGKLHVADFIDDMVAVDAFFDGNKHVASGFNAKAFVKQTMPTWWEFFGANPTFPLTVEFGKDHFGPIVATPHQMLWEAYHTMALKYGSHFSDITMVIDTAQTAAELYAAEPITTNKKPSNIRDFYGTLVPTTQFLKDELVFDKCKQ